MGPASLLSAWLAFAGSPSVGERLELSWTAPAGCPTQTQVRASIDEYLGRDEFGEAIAQVEIAGRIEPVSGGRFRLGIVVRLPGGTVDREVEAALCEELAAAAGLMIAVALDPLRVVDVVRPPPAPAPATPDPAPAAEPRLGVGLRAGGAGQLGVLPGFGAGVWAALALVGPRYRVEVSGQYWLPQEVKPFEDKPRAGARIQFGAAAARACFVPTAGRFEFPSCVAIEVGAARAHGIGLAQTRVSHRPWVAGVVGQELVWVSRRRVGVWLGADGLLNISRPSFLVDDLGTVFETGVAAFRFVGGPLLRF